MQPPDELLIWDEPDDCPYLPGRTSRLPLRLPTRMLSPAEFDVCLERGDRRSGQFLYSPACPDCAACEPIRLDVATFRPSRTQQRVWRRNERLFHSTIGAPILDDERVALFNRHKDERGLSDDQPALDASGYHAFLVDSCCETREMAYYLENELVMVAIVDVGATSLSAVYTYFAPALARYSLGVYSVLKQVEFCRATDRRHLYLGYFVAGSAHMIYKATYQPHERRIGGEWRTP
jgi:arginyl-tRNA--protein-N-Asp/Glu arginylyltransferase